MASALALGFLVGFPIAASPGWHACAWQFVNAQTGQVSLRLPLPVVQVP